MNFFSTLKRALTGTQTIKPLKLSGDTYCSISVKLRNSEFLLLAQSYYRGCTSYKSFFREVFTPDIGTLLALLEKARKKADTGCYIDSTFIQFHAPNSLGHVIEIPFDVFSNKQDLPIYIRNGKTWNTHNILRILELYPEFRKYDDEMVNRENRDSQY